MRNKHLMPKDSFINELFEKYIECFPDEKNTLAHVSKQMSSDNDLTNRKNMRGHCTASIFLVCQKTKRVLLLDHKALKMKLQPGGHIDPKETPLTAALRELAEETGIKDGFELRSLIPGDREVPLNIDSHHIPENIKKAEGEHFHHDFQYLALSQCEKDVQVTEVETEGFQWTDWNDFVAQHKFKQVALKIEEYINQRSAGVYYENIIDQKTIDTIRAEKINCLVVQHIIPSTIEFIRFLRAVFGDDLQVLAKPKSVDQQVLSELREEGIDIILANREDNFEKYISGKTVLMDIGGYFVRIAQKKGLPIVGIVEDTENGLQKYQEVKKDLKYPVVSVARSELKKNEDKLVGEAVVHAVDTILRQDNIVIDYCRCGIVGYGKVGAGIAKGLLKRGVKPYVVEKDPVRLVAAVNDYCYAADIDYLAKRSKVIFGATGRGALSTNVLRKVKNGSYIASVTSSDSEFDILALENEYQTKKVTDFVTKYINQDNYFYLINDGNAVNFLYNAALGSFIYLVLGEELAVVESLVRSKKYKTGISSSQENITRVAEKWLREFITLNPRD